MSKFLELIEGRKEDNNNDLCRCINIAIYVSQYNIQIHHVCCLRIECLSNIVSPKESYRTQQPLVVLAMPDGLRA